VRACVWIGAGVEVARALDITDCVVRSTRCWQKSEAGVARSWCCWWTDTESDAVVVVCVGEGGLGSEL
jgi:hypothetical protein